MAVFFSGGEGGERREEEGGFIKKNSLTARINMLLFLIKVSVTTKVDINNYVAQLMVN